MVFDLLASWGEPFLSGLQDLVTDRMDDGHALQESLTTLEQARVVLSSAARRPNVAVYRAAEEVVRLATAAADGWLETVAADDPLSAQRHHERAQGSLDTAAEVAGSLGEALGRWRRISEAKGVEDALGVLYAEAVALGGHDDLLELEEAGARDYSALVNQPCPAGVGMALRLTSLLAEVVLDPERFMKVLREAIDVLRRDQVSLTTLLASTSLPSDLLEGELHGSYSWLTAQAVWATSRTTEHDLRELVDLGGKIVEGPGKRYVAALTAITRGHPYEQRRTVAANQLIREAQSDGLGPLIEGLDTVLRNSAAHLDYLVNDDTVVLTSHSQELSPPRHMGSGQLIDEVLEAAETCAALGLALLSVAEASDCPLIDGSVFLRRLGVSVPETIALAFRLAGLADPDVEVHGVDLAVRATASAARPKLFRALAIALPYAPADAQSVKLVVQAGDERLDLAGPIEPWRRWAHATGDLEKQLAYVEWLASMRYNKARVVSQDQIRKVFAVCAAQEFNERTYPGFIDPLRMIRAAALRIGDDELAVSVQRLMTVARLTASGESLSIEEREAVDRIVGWASLTLEELSEP